jgi:hypothetical protein
VAICRTTVCHLQLLRTLASLMPMSKTCFAINRPTRRAMVRRRSIIEKWTVHQKHRRPHPHLQPKIGPSPPLNFAFDLVVILSTMLRRSQPRSPPQKLLLIPASLLRDFHSCLTVRQRAKARARSHPSPDVHRPMVLSARLVPPMPPMVVIPVVIWLCSNTDQIYQPLSSQTVLVRLFDVIFWMTLVRHS